MGCVQFHQSRRRGFLSGTPAARPWRFLGRGLDVLLHRPNLYMLVDGVWQGGPQWGCRGACASRKLHISLLREVRFRALVHFHAHDGPIEQAASCRSWGRSAGGAIVPEVELTVFIQRGDGEGGRGSRHSCDYLCRRGCTAKHILHPLPHGPITVPGFRKNEKGRRRTDTARNWTSQESNNSSTKNKPFLCVVVPPPGYCERRQCCSRKNNYTQ